MKIVGSLIALFFVLGAQAQSGSNNVGNQAELSALIESSRVLVVAPGKSTTTAQILARAIADTHETGGVKSFENECIIKNRITEIEHCELEIEYKNGGVIEIDYTVKRVSDVWVLQVVNLANYRDVPELK